jgi:site-specific DNA-methyltransferase (adenine-specific)
MIFEKIPAQYPYEATPSILAYIPKLELAKSLVKFASTEGDLIVDPFCGSGEFVEAAKNLGRDYIGGDISEKAVTLTKGRL